MVEIVPQFFRTAEENLFKRWLARLDWSLVGAALGLSALSLAFVYSATAHGGHGGAFVARQGTAVLMGLTGMMFLAFLPYQVFQTYARPVYIATVLVLLAVLVAGSRLRGSRSWFHLGFFYFQPVELTRLGLAVALSAYAAVRSRDMEDWRAMIPPLAMAGGHLGLILLQPDLSSALSMGPMTLAILYVAGAPVWALSVLVGGTAIALGIPLASTYYSIIHASPAEGFLASLLRKAFMERQAFLLFWGGVCLLITLGWWFLRKWRVYVSGLALTLSLAVVVGGVAGSFVVQKALKDYQRKRLIAFLDPAIDPLGSGYNILQSKITLGSGRFIGKGYLGGSQSQLGFLPEKHTDFIFSLVGEELGFVGAMLVLGTYFWIVFRAFDIASAARDRFGRHLAVGVGTYFAFTGLVNIGMVMGLMPVTGVPLPFMSYGGSGMFGAFLAVGLLLSVHLRRYIL